MVVVFLGVGSPICVESATEGAAVKVLAFPSFPGAAQKSLPATSFVTVAPALLLTPSNVPALLRHLSLSFLPLLSAKRFVSHITTAPPKMFANGEPQP